MRVDRQEPVYTRMFPATFATTLEDDDVVNADPPTIARYASRAALRTRFRKVQFRQVTIHYGELSRIIDSRFKFTHAVEEQASLNGAAHRVQSIGHKSVTQFAALG